MTSVLDSDVWHGDGAMTLRATEMLLDIIPSPKGLLTTSCTHALELAGILLDLGPGDEVIVPSFTFSSTASSIAIRGATPVFVDVDSMLNLDVALVEQAITDRTKAIYVVHYAGVGADMEALLPIANRHGLRIVEDNAHGLGATRGGQYLGTFGAMATQSFHDTKNVTCGEGGALLINDASLTERAEIVREKGTNRSQFLRGQVDKYTWVDSGSSFLPSDLLAALLVAQLTHFEVIQQWRHRVWDRYAAALAAWSQNNAVNLMQVPEQAQHPAHMFYVLMPTHGDQTGLIKHLKEAGIVATFHYQPLHDSPAGSRFGRQGSHCPMTSDRALRLVRLPLYAGLTEADVDRVVEAVLSYRCDGGL